MNVSEHNRKVALSRWEKKHSEEKLRIKSDKESLLLKASICGFLAGDGSVQKRKEKNNYHYQIDFFPDDKIMMDTYINYIKTIYNKSPTIRKKNQFYTVRFTSKVVVEDLFQIANFGLKDWNMPKSLTSIEGAKENWLKAFFSAEAYVSPRSIKIQTVNKTGMLEIASALQELGINTKYYEYKPKNENHSTVSILFINRKDDRLTYLKKIGFWHAKKTKILKKALGF